MARKTRQRLFELIKKSGVNVSSLSSQFAAKIELVHPNTSFDQNEMRLLPTPPFSPHSRVKENRRNCSEGAQLLLLLKRSH
jgi:hypothetical protein